MRSVPVLRDSDRCVRLVAEMSFSDLCSREFGDVADRHLQLARRHLDGGRYEKAERVLKQLVSAWPEFGDAWYLQAVVKYCQKEYVAAIGLARRAASLNANHFAASALEGKAWVDVGMPSRALTAFNRSFAINPSQTMVKGYIDVLNRQVRAGEK